MSREKPHAEVDLPWSQPKEGFYQMCLDKSLLLFLTRVKGKMYFAPKRQILSCLLNSPVNQEEPETSALQLPAFILFAKLKGELSFWGGLCLFQAAGRVRNVGHTMQGHREEAGCLPRSQSGWHAQEPRSSCRTLLMASCASHSYGCLWSHWLQQGSTSTHKPRTYLCSAADFKYFDTKSVPQ